MFRSYFYRFQHFSGWKRSPRHPDKIPLRRDFVLLTGKSAKSTVCSATIGIRKQEVYATELGVSVKPPRHKSQGHGSSQ